MQSRSKAAIFWPIIAVVTVVDVITKAIAERSLIPRGIPHEVFGNTVRLTLVYNPGAAFGLNLGPQSRWIFAVLTVIALVILARLYRSTARGDATRTVALGLVCAGAVGNLIDRVRSLFGVVDFIDIGFGDSRWPTFNVADMAVSVGAALLAWVLWQEDRSAVAAQVGQPAVPASASGGKPGDLA
ncbi:MAG: Lipoprotein signal peptidase [Gemmatimonadetes bacterium]|nr:Lipoprotein signal peptidase [Gemmatimonadota bacterium]